MKKILVTGGAGFIGSHLCYKLLQDKNNFVYCLDNLSTGYKNNIKHLSDRKNFQFILHDIINPLNILVDEIYNFACPASPPQYQKNPVFTLKTNVIGSNNMLELAAKNKAKIMQASTSEVYGDPQIHPQVESYFGNVNPIGPRSCYDEGKRCAETLFFDYHRNYNLDIRVIRIFNTYGPKMDRYDGRVVSNFINQALNDEDITVYGDGNHTRSFQFISDLLEGIEFVMNGEEIGPFNIGNPNEFTIMQLAELVLKKVPKSKSKIVFKEIPEDDPKIRKPDISKINKTYGWSPQIDLDTGIEKTINYFNFGTL